MPARRSPTSSPACARKRSRAASGRRSSTQALSNIEEPLPVVIERDRRQAETVLSLETYLSRLVTPRLVTRGRAAFSSQTMLLEEVGARYGVPPAILAAIWGIESNFGGFSGVRPTIAALATLAWEARRAALFRSELFAALEILDRGDIELGSAARLVGGRHGSAAVHAVELSEIRRRTSTAMAGGISGRRLATSSRRLPTTCREMAGRPARAGAAKSWSRRPPPAGSPAASPGAPAPARPRAT